jgi:hypothetical protein
MPKEKIPQLPSFLKTKIYKTGQTRGADDDQIYQNRVSRNSTVLIPFQDWESCFVFPDLEKSFESGYIALVPPKVFFENNTLKQKNLILGENALLFYEKREDWEEYNPVKNGMRHATSRLAPLGGEFVARVPATTAVHGGEKINLGFNTRDNKGAGIRIYEYATMKTIKECRIQLEALFWSCLDSKQKLIDLGWSELEVEERYNYSIETANQLDLLDYIELRKSRIINHLDQTICPLCLEPLSAEGFFSSVPQALGRQVFNLTITNVNLFHIKELKVKEYNHRPYNLGWGHHHCNVVTKDNGIKETIDWMRLVLERNNHWCEH